MRIVIAISLLLAAQALQAQSLRSYVFFARMDGTHMLESGHNTYIWGFSQGDLESPPPELELPNPPIEVEEGDTVEVMLINISGEGHTIHWHGLDTDQANDGTPHTSQYVQPWDTFTYRFVATHAGNYMYHCHVTTTLHLMMGMYGKFIVRVPGANRVYPGGPTYTRDYTYLGSELDQRWNDDYMSGGPLNEFSPTHFLLDGKSGQQIADDSTMHISMLPGDTVLLRLLNVGFSMHRYLFPPGVQATIVASDGREVPQHFSTDTLDIYPGERYSVLLRTTNPALMDWIRVTYHHLHKYTPQGFNYIPINTGQLPQGIYQQIPRFHVYPNPVSGTLQIAGASERTHYEILDITGKPVISGNGNAIATDRLKQGIYLLLLSVPGGETARLKFVKAY